MTNLSPDARDILDKAHAALTPSAVTKMQVFEEIEKQIAAGPSGSAQAGSGLLTKFLIALTVAAGIGGGAWFLNRQSPTTISEVPTTSEAAVPAVIAEPQVAEPAVQQPAIAEPALVEEHIVMDDVPIPTTKRTKKRSAPESTASSLLAERKLISAAQRAIREGAHAEALRLLSEHKAKFPSGVMSPERRAAQAITLCLDGRADEGAVAAARFLKRHPKSPLATRVRRSCASILDADQ